MKNKILIYDDNCPLCSWYSKAFVKCGLLPAEGRKAFSTLDSSLFAVIDFNKSRNEIPLLDRETGTVHYGIDALLEILGQRFPIIKITGRFTPVKWFLKKLYKLISYNRKVIVAKKCGQGAIDCSPDISYFYRYLFMGLFLVFNTLMLYPLHTVVLSRLSYYHLSSAQLQVAHFLLVLVNLLLALTLSLEKATEYLGQVNMLALLVILLLMPLLLLQNIFQLKEWFTSLYLGLTAILIFKEYIRRMEYAGVLSADKWLVSINLASLTGFMFFLFK